MITPPKPDECAMCFRKIAAATVQPYPQGNLCEICIVGGVRFGGDRFRMSE